jgi:hypothetical protein
MTTDFAMLPQFFTEGGSRRILPDIPENVDRDKVRVSPESVRAIQEERKAPIRAERARLQQEFDAIREALGGHKHQEDKEARKRQQALTQKLLAEPAEPGEPVTTSTVAPEPRRRPRRPDEVNHG